MAESLGRRVGRWSAYVLLATCFTLAVTAPFVDRRRGARGGGGSALPGPTRTTSADGSSGDGARG
jgi:hypothetical protein